MCTVCMQMRDKRDGLILCAPTEPGHLLGEFRGHWGIESYHISDCAFKLCITLLLTPRTNSFMQGSLPCLSKLIKHTKPQTNWFLGLKLRLVFDCESMQQFMGICSFPSCGDDKPTSLEFRTVSWWTLILKCWIRGIISWELKLRGNA